MKNAPATATSRSGRSFATVAIELRRTPSATPRRLITDQKAKREDEDGRFHGAAAQCRHQEPQARRKHGRDRGGSKGPEHPQQHARDEARVGPERSADIGVGTAGQRDTAAGIGNTQHDESHGECAHQIRSRGRRAQRCRHIRGQPEDAAADGDVDNRGRQPERPHDANERLVALRQGRRRD